MSDIWSGIGVDIAPREGEWLYRAHGEMHGPIPKKALIERLLRGHLDLDTPVAKEGGEFHPIGRVAAFAPHLKEAKKQEAKRVAKKRFRLGLLIMVPVLGAASVGGFFVWEHIEAAKKQRLAKQKAMQKDLEKRRKSFAKQDKMGLVALVALPSAKEVKIRSTPVKRPKAPKRPGRPATKEEPVEAISSCERSQQEILGTLARHLGKINVCVEDEKSRDKQGLLPPSLGLSFVVKPSGKIVEFGIADRHYRTGPMKNCMTKAFSRIRYPAAGGSNCPIDIPIRIGG